MSKDAIRIYSESVGLFSETVNALDVKSRENARKLGPFCSVADNSLVYWVNWGAKKDGKKVKPYFRKYRSVKSVKEQINDRLKVEIDDIVLGKNNKLHNKVQDILVNSLRSLVSDNKKLAWYFKDERLSEFPLSGDLLSDVVAVKKEYRINPPFVNYYDLDIALIGKNIVNKPIILGAIEIENKNEVDLLKTLLCKSLGFPLLTINIKNIDIDMVNEEWCMDRLMETTGTSTDGRRRNYIYVHNMLYPVYLDSFQGWGVEDSHQYIVFARDGELDKLVKYLGTLKNALGVNDQDAKFIVNNRNFNDKGSNSLFENEGSLAGDNWESYNDSRFLRIVLSRPKDKRGVIYQFHIVMAQIMTLHVDCIVGYKYSNGLTNSFKEEPFWYASRSEYRSNEMPKYKWFHKKFCPKRISEPVMEIMNYIIR